MNSKSLFFAFFCLFTLTAFSQTVTNLNCTVKGMVIDSLTTQSLAYVTVSVSSISTPDVYLKRIASDAKGNFELQLNKAGNYVLSFESVGMKKLLRNISIKPEQKTINLGKISMSTASKALGEVTITATKPLVKVDIDKIAYDIKSDPESASNNVLEMLKKVPMVSVDGEDKIQVKGSSSFKVFINGKPSAMVASNPSQVLKSMPASSIKSIEVITEPGAKYDAEGVGGIINIITEKSLSGLTGTVRGSVNSYGGYSAGLFLSTKIKKFGLTANLNHNFSHDPGQIWNSVKENLNPSTVKYVYQSSASVSDYAFDYGNIEASYEIDTLNLISFTMGGHLGGGDTFASGLTASEDSNNNILTSFGQNTSTNEKWGGVELNLDYQHSYKKPDKLLTFSYKLSQSPDYTDSYTNLIGIINHNSYNEHIKYDASGTEHTIQLDYTEPFNKIHIIDFGAKYILRLNNSINSYLHQQPVTADWTAMPNRPNDNLDQVQNIAGLYGSYTLKLEKFSLKAGLRYEQTWSNISLPDTSFKINFRNLVPSVSVSYKLNDANSLKLSYNQRISRPGIWYLNPFINNSNPYYIIQGNPNLQPELNNAISLNYNYTSQKLNIVTSLFYSYINNSIESIRKSMNDSVVYSTYKNIGNNQISGLSVYGSWNPDKNLRINANLFTSYNSYSAPEISAVTNSGFNYYASMNGQYTFPLDIKLSLNGSYSSPRISLQGRGSSYFFYGFSVSKDFLKKSLNISLFTRNPFNQYNSFISNVLTSDFSSTDISQRLARLFGLSISFKFGELKEQIKKVDNSISNDDVKGGSGH